MDEVEIEIDFVLVGNIKLRMKIEEVIASFLWYPFDWLKI